ncbi:MAG: metallophosphoesterase family protein [Candidatus Bathyarchaeia archaeon]
MLKIAQISDTHITPYGRFMENIYDRLISEVNAVEPDIVVHSGDVTDWGFLEDYKLARDAMKLIEAETIVIPGNHDSRNLGNLLFPRFFGKRYKCKGFEGFGIIALDTTVPDLDTGRLGRSGQRHLVRYLNRFDGSIRIVMIHHHLIPVPEAGRERNLIDDAGDVLKVITKKGAELVLMGHRHVPNVARVENTILVNAGTLSSVKTRGYHGHSFNLISIAGRWIKVEIVKLLEGRITKRVVGNYKLT